MENSAVLISTSAAEAPGTLNNPYPQNNTELFDLHINDGRIPKQILINVDSVITGVQANKIFKETSDGASEWRVITFNLQYASGSKMDLLDVEKIFSAPNFVDNFGNELSLNADMKIEVQKNGIAVKNAKLLPGEACMITVAFSVNKVESRILLQINTDGENRQNLVLCCENTEYFNMADIKKVAAYDDFTDVADFGKYFNTQAIFTEVIKEKQGIYSYVALGTDVRPIIYDKLLRQQGFILNDQYIIEFEEKEYPSYVKGNTLVAIGNGRGFLFIIVSKI